VALAFLIDESLTPSGFKEAITPVRETVKGKIDEKITARRLPKVHRWERPHPHGEAI